MNRLNFARLYYFYVVAKAGSQAAGARELGVTQSTISEQLKLLESELRTRLFVRRGSSQALTDEGRRTLEHAESIFEAGDRLLADLDVVLPARPVLEIGITPAACRTFAADLLSPVTSDEQVCPRISIADERLLLPRLSAGELHLLVSETEPRGRTTRRFRSNVARHLNFVVVAAPRLAATTDDGPVLDRKPWVHFTTSSGFRWAIDAELRARDVTPDIVAETDDLELLRLAALRGVGLAALPERIVTDDLAAGRLVRLHTLPEPLPLYVSYLRDGLATIAQATVRSLALGSAPRTNGSAVRDARPHTDSAS